MGIEKNAGKKIAMDAFITSRWSTLMASKPARCNSTAARLR
jgi:hypothetical protein